MDSCAHHKFILMRHGEIILKRTHNKCIEQTQIIPSEAELNKMQELLEAGVFQLIILQNMLNTPR